MLGTEAQQRRLFGEVLRAAGSATRWPSAAPSTPRISRPGCSRRGGAAAPEGRKYYCTGALTARWIAVTAMDERDRLVVAFVDRDDEGVTVLDDWNVMGQRATVSGSTVFDNVTR